MQLEHPLPDISNLRSLEVGIKEENTLWRLSDVLSAFIERDCERSSDNRESGQHHFKEDAVSPFNPEDKDQPISVVGKSR